MYIKQAQPKITYRMGLELEDHEINNIEKVLAALYPPPPSTMPKDASEVEGLDHPSDFTETVDIPTSRWVDFQLDHGITEQWATVRELLETLVTKRDDFLTDAGLGRTWPT